MYQRTRKVRPGAYVQEVPSAPDHVNCRCAVVPTFEWMINRALMNTLEPNRILKNGPVTVVFWKDGTKTVVKPGPNVTPNDYDAFTAALAIKVFDSNSHLKKMIKEKTVEQKPKVKKSVETEGESE